MTLLLDTHLHTSRHSSCSRIDEKRLLQQAVKRGLDGLVLTEHHYQWPESELQQLLDESGVPGFVLLAGFEYTSRRGDILVYGLAPEQVADFAPGGAPEVMLEQFQRLGAVCFAAHPTRAGLGFDAQIEHMPFDGIETRSVNLQPHEQRLALRLAETLKLPATAASDAHRIEDVGAYALEMDAVVRSMADFCAAIRARKFRPAAVNAGLGTGTRG